MLRINDTMYDIEEHQVPRLRRVAGPVRQRLPVVAKPQFNTVERPSGSFSAELLTSKERGQETTVLRLRGEIDFAIAPALFELLLTVLDRGTGAVVVDLFEVPFMDSSGVHFLIDALRRLQDQSRRLAVACPEGGQVYRLLALVGLLDAVTVHRSRETALNEGDDLVRSPNCTTTCPTDARAL